MDSAQVTVNVKVPPVQFVPNPADGTKNYSIDATAGLGFTLGIPYQFGVGPFTAALQNAPAWAAADTNTPGYVTVTGTPPENQAEGPVVFGVTVTDSRGTAASTTAAVN